VLAQGDRTAESNPPGGLGEPAPYGVLGFLRLDRDGAAMLIELRADSGGSSEQDALIAKAAAAAIPK
jgi:hypothetical protein